MNKLRELSRKEQKTYVEWLAEKEAVQRMEPAAHETPSQRTKRINRLKKDFVEFCKYYFEDFGLSEFGWFHTKATKLIEENKDLLLVAEWPREHAKSVFFDIFMPLYLKARGELSGVVLASSTEQKADGLLADLQEQLMFNRRYIADYGTQYQSGKWDTGSFVTADGLGFWAFGRGQSPRGIREGALRPNYGVADDMDDAEIVKNEKRTDEAVDWLLGDLYGALPIKGSRFIVTGNRIHKKSILAKVVGDVEDGDPKREGVTHLKVYALENPRTHKMDMSETGVPAWGRYTRAQIMRKMNQMGYRLGLRELFHQHIVIGRVFKEEHLPWAKLPPFSACEKLVTYCDPSYKDTKKNDFKAILLIGKNGKYFDVYKAFCRQCTTPEMVRGHYNMAELIPASKVCRHWMEANFIQDIHLKAYDTESETRGYAIAIRGDRRKKPEKLERIEDLSAYTERGLIRFNIDEKGSPDMQEVRNQFLGFPDAPHDDAPDACEGGIYKLNKSGTTGKTTTTSGKYTRNTGRRG
jgi:phage terminase large subunit-like protein